MDLLKPLTRLLARRSPSSYRLPDGQRVVMIVGMHRSGTSFLTGSLQQAGLELGKHSEWNPHNLKGNRENGDIVQLNDAVLASHGYSWDSPPDHELSWSDDQLARGGSIIEGYQHVKCWGFKDPRTVLVIDGWRRLLPAIEFVGIFRHPLAVAHSLDARGGMSRDKAFKLWENYNRRLLSLHAQRPFPVLCFDEPIDVLLPKLDRVIEALGLESGQATRGETAFYSAELKHHAAVEAALPPHIDALFTQLKAIAQ